MTRAEFDALWGMLTRYVGDEYGEATDPYIWLHMAPIRKEDLYRRIQEGHG